MIPLRLHLKNFLSYGSPAQVINFEPYHLICLSGKNGHGKSALLDAITWSLWGQARKAMSATRADANLLRLGTTNMVVALDFICNNRTYRVRREYNNESGKNMTYLDFGIYDEQTGQWRQLTTKSIRETQEFIVSVIGLDVEAFENSAFLRQGHSDEFSRKSPKDRKEMLANIIGLGLYEVLRKKSIEKGREESLRYQNSMRTCDILKQAIAPQNSVTQELQLVDETYKNADVLDQQCIQRNAILCEELQKLHYERQQAEKLLAVFSHVNTQIEREASELRTLWNQWRDIRKQHQFLKGKHPSKQRREDILRELALVEQQLQKKVHLMNSVAEIKDNIRLRKLTKQQEHENELKNLVKQEQLCEQQQKIVLHDEQRLNALHADTIALLDALEQEEKKLVVVENILALESDILALEKQYEYCCTRLQHGLAMQHRLNRDVERAAHEQQKIAELHNAVCTACLQTIQPDHMSKLIVFHKQRESRLMGQKKRLDGLVLCYQDRAKSFQEKLYNLRDKYKQAVCRKAEHDACCMRKQHIQTQALDLEKQLQALKEAQKTLDVEWNIIKNKIKIIHKRQKDEAINDELLQDLSKRLADCESELLLLECSHERYNQLQKELTILAEEDIVRAHVMQELKLQDDRASQIKQRCKNLRRLKYKQRERLQVCEQQIKLQEIIVTKENEVRTLQEERDNVVRDKERLANQKGSLEQTIRYINQQKLLLEQERKQLQSYDDNVSDYTMLAQVLSKDGIQGMLIEHILPEIEHEANLLLAKLTDNQAQLQFESLRGLKSGALKETLEIKISDSLGTRPYEMFSGGEAFRIDFALRLAISKLLARRAGASVQTLIIDEGFGSQDEEGLHYIMESLYAIQHEFAKIIIVSHLPAMKDQFPTHFYVCKGTQGSVVHLIEQG